MAIRSMRKPKCWRNAHPPPNPIGESCGCDRSGASRMERSSWTWNGRCCFSNEKRGTSKYVTQQESSMRPRRCLLFMPGDDLKKIQKGIGLGVDSIVMDLEDGVALNRKAEARATIATALRDLHFGRSERMVRINPIGSGLAQADLDAVLPYQP